MEKMSTIAVDEEVKREMDKMKVHPREPYNDVLRRTLKLPKTVGDEK